MKKRILILSVLFCGLVFLTSCSKKVRDTDIYPGRAVSEASQPDASAVLSSAVSAAVSSLSRPVSAAGGAARAGSKTAVTETGGQTAAGPASGNGKTGVLSKTTPGGNAGAVKLQYVKDSGTVGRIQMSFNWVDFGSIGFQLGESFNPAQINRAVYLDRENKQMATDGNKTVDTSLYIVDLGDSNADTVDLMVEKGTNKILWIDLEHVGGQFMNLCFNEIDFTKTDPLSIKSSEGVPAVGKDLSIGDVNFVTRSNVDGNIIADDFSASNGVNTLQLASMSYVTPNAAAAIGAVNSSPGRNDRLLKLYESKQHPHTAAKSLDGVTVRLSNGLTVSPGENISAFSNALFCGPNGGPGYDKDGNTIKGDVVYLLRDDGGKPPMPTSSHSASSDEDLLLAVNPANGTILGIQVCAPVFKTLGVELNGKKITLTDAETAFGFSRMGQLVNIARGGGDTAYDLGLSKENGLVVNYSSYLPVN